MFVRRVLATWNCNIHMYFENKMAEMYLGHSCLFIKNYFQINLRQNFTYQNIGLFFLITLWTIPFYNITI